MSTQEELFSMLNLDSKEEVEYLKNKVSFLEQHSKELSENISIDTKCNDFCHHKDKLEKTLNSRSWKITRPLRVWNLRFLALNQKIRFFLRFRSITYKFLK